MAVDIDVNLNKIDTRDIAKIEAQLASIGDDLDLDFDLDDVLDGDFDEIELHLDEDNLKSQIQRAMHKVNADMEAGVFEPFSGGEGVGGTNLLNRQLVRIVSELQSVNRKLAGNNLGQNISVTENLPNLRNKVGKHNLDLGVIPDSDSERIKLRRGLMNGIRLHPSEFTFGGKTLDDMLGAGGGPAPGVPRRVQDLMEKPGSELARARRKSIQNASLNGDTVSYDREDRLRERIARTKKQFGKLDFIGEALAKTFNKIRPSFRKVYAITATLLPAIAGLAIQGAAVAASFAAIGAAGAAIGILGMLGGEANTLAGSMKQAEDRMEDFKKSLFGAVEPVADLFGPIVDRALNAIVQNVRGLTDELAALQGYEGILFRGLNATFALAEGLLQTIVSLRPVISGVASKFGNLIGGGLVEFFQDVIIEGAKSSDTLANIAGLLFQLGRAVYFTLKAVVNLVRVLAVFTPAIKTIANILGNRFIQGLLVALSTLITVIGILYTGYKALMLLKLGLLTLNAALVANGSLWAAVSSIISTGFVGSIMRAISTIPALIIQLWNMNAALGVTAALVTAITGGLAALGAIAAIGAGANAFGDMLNPDVPISGSGSYGSGGGAGTYNDVTMNFQGDMDSASRQKMVDVTEGVMYQDDLSNGQFGAYK